MNNVEYEQVIAALIATAEIMGTEIKPAVAVMMVDDLSDHAFFDVMNALKRARRESSGKLTLKTVLDLLQPAGGWLSANEAWATSLPALDEAATVVWTAEMAKAFEIARPLLEGGDKIGARMAFIPAYERLIEQAKKENRTPVYQVSEGWDTNMRQIALQNAATAGLLPELSKGTATLLNAPETQENRLDGMNGDELRRKIADFSAQLKNFNREQMIKKAEQQLHERMQHNMNKQKQIQQLQAKT